MPNFRTALLSRLEADSEIAAIVGTKIYWTLVPQGTAKPYIRLQVISDPRLEHLKGYNNGRQSWVQADVFGASYGQGISLAERIISVMSIPGVVDGIKFGHTKAEGPVDMGEETSAGLVHRARVDLIIEHVS